MCVVSCAFTFFPVGLVPLWVVSPLGCISFPMPCWVFCPSGFYFFLWRPVGCVPFWVPWVPCRNKAPAGNAKSLYVRSLIELQGHMYVRTVADNLMTTMTTTIIMHATLIFPHWRLIALPCGWRGDFYGFGLGIGAKARIDLHMHGCLDSLRPCYFYRIRVMHWLLGVSDPGFPPRPGVLFLSRSRFPPRPGGRLFF